jgi:formylglycine-generating enzyme required for sulfatase activity
VGIRLPGRDQDAYSFGDDPEKLGEYAWFYDNSNESIRRSAEEAQPAGLHDMHGNG